MNKKLHKLLHWEYWPSSMFYVPNLPYAFYLAFKARHSAFFSATNPAIKSGGNGTESKYETIQLVPKKYRPKSVLVKPNTNFQEVLNALKTVGITFPLIAKPDIGFRGLLVKKLSSESALQTYLQNYPINIIIQEFLDYKEECGVFYHRNPEKNEGFISSVTLKRFLSVVGNGKNTLKELILADERAKLYIKLLEKMDDLDLSLIPKEKEKINLSAIGNHSKGTQFINGNHLITKELEHTFDKLSKAIDGWYYGRVDIKYNTFDALENGTDFKVLEINGIIAEPTDIYDSKNYSYFKALKAIRTHWKSLYNIAISNHKNFAVPYKSSRKFIGEMRELRAYTKKVQKLAKNS